MSSTTQIVTTIASFAATATGGVTAFLKQAKKAEAKVNSLVIRYEAMLNTVLSEVTKLEAAVTKALPQPAPAPAPKAAKAPAVKKATRRAGK